MQVGVFAAAAQGAALESGQGKARATAVDTYKDYDFLKGGDVHPDHTVGQRQGKFKGGFFRRHASSILVEQQRQAKDEAKAARQQAIFEQRKAHLLRQNTRHGDIVAHTGNPEQNARPAKKRVASPERQSEDRARAKYGAGRFHVEPDEKDVLRRRDSQIKLMRSQSSTVLGFGRPELPSQGALDAFTGHGYDEKEIADRPSVQTSLAPVYAQLVSASAAPGPASYGPPAAGSPSGGKRLPPLALSGSQSLAKLPTVSPQKRRGHAGLSSDNVSAVLKDTDPSAPLRRGGKAAVGHPHSSGSEAAAALRHDNIEQHHAVGVRTGVAGAIGGAARRKASQLHQLPQTQSSPAAASGSSAAGAGSWAAVAARPAVVAAAIAGRPASTAAAPAPAAAAAARPAVPPVAGLAAVASTLS